MAKSKYQLRPRVRITTKRVAELKIRVYAAAAADCARAGVRASEIVRARRRAKVGLADGASARVLKTHVVYTTTAVGFSFSFYPRPADNAVGIRVRTGYNSVTLSRDNIYYNDMSCPCTGDARSDRRTRVFGIRFSAVNDRDLKISYGGLLFFFFPRNIIMSASPQVLAKI